MSERFTLNELKRIGLQETATGGWFQPTTMSLNTQQKTGHGLWESAARGGKRAFSGMETIGGQIWNGQTDPIKHIKKFDPQNTSGAIPDGLDIMGKMLNVARGDELQPSINPLGTILGGELYGNLTSFMNNFGAASKGGKGGNEKTNNNEDLPENTIDPIIIQLVQAALKRLSVAEATQQQSLLNSNEYDRIQTAFFGRTQYASGRMSTNFVRTINDLFPVFRRSQGIV